ncbi:hypothetical protein SLS64_001874 [Diaporthe eres]|uniref:Uncharacterized protein n=1 Tax=Diaporthe eres TaxID=83184 RepID=A0ABR1PNU9_DIAER
MGLHIVGYDGDLTIRLSSGLSIRIPNSQFLVPYVEIARDGTRVSNDSLVDLLVNSIGGNRTATLGRYVLTAAYFMVDYDANTFMLWQANPSSGSPNLVPVVEESTGQSCTTSSGGGGGATTNTPSTPATADPQPAVRAGDQPVKSLDDSANERARPDVLTEMPDASPTPEMVATDLYPEMDGPTIHLEGIEHRGLNSHLIRREDRSTSWVVTVELHRIIDGLLVEVEKA